jgi:hypothetical protein
MASVQISRALRLAVEQRCADMFNDALASACSDFGISELAYAISFGGGDPQNFYRGNRTLEQLVQMQEPDFPAVAMWTGLGGPLPQGEREFPRTFSGAVFVGWRFFVAVKGLRSTGLVDLCEATESALVATLAPEFSEVGYRGDLYWQSPPELIWVDQDRNHVGFIQEIEFQASFRVSV